MKKPARHYLDVYGVHVRLAGTQKQWAALVRRCEGLPESETPGLTAAMEYKDAYLVAVLVDSKAAPDDEQLLGLIAHESAHAAGMVFDLINEAENRTSEAMAYLTQWFAMRIWAHIKGDN